MKRKKNTRTDRLIEPITEYNPYRPRELVTEDQLFARYGIAAAKRQIDLIERIRTAIDAEKEGE